MPCPECTEQPCDPWDDLCRDPVRIVTIDPGVEGISPNNLEYNVDLFNLRLDYHNPNNNNPAEYYNGNIAGARWRSGIGSIFDYRYEYDVLDRLKEADFSPVDADNSMVISTVDFVPILGDLFTIREFEVKATAYSVSDINYDFDGNITQLWRKTLEQNTDDTTVPVYLDKLSYDYDGMPNQLTSITNTENSNESVKSGSFNYDANGNLIADSGKVITRIDYNHLNLPVYIEFGSASTHLKIYYNANGKKLKKEAKPKIGPTIITHYIDGIEYKETTPTLPRLEAIYHAEGRVVPDDTNPHGLRYEFTLTDHLGNSRVMFTDKNQDGLIQEEDILQEEHYYPFGGKIDGPWAITNSENPNDYQYNGKEFNGDFGLDWLDYGARWYDPGIGRWNAVDPLAEQMPSWSPYNYTFCNPVKYTDPDGRNPILGAIIGGVIGGAASIATQLYQGQDVSLWDAGKSALSGAATGAVIGSGAGVVTAMGGFVGASSGGIMVTTGTGITAGIVGETTSQLLDKADGTRENMDLAAIAESGAIGGALNIATAGAGHMLKKPVTEMAQKIFSSDVKGAVKTAQKTASKQAKKLGKTKQQIRTERSTAKSQTRAETLNTALKQTTTASQTVIMTINTSAKKTTTPLIKNRDR